MKMHNKVELLLFLPKTFPTDAPIEIIDDKDTDIQPTPIIDSSTDAPTPTRYNSSSYHPTNPSQKRQSKKSKKSPFKPSFKNYSYRPQNSKKPKQLLFAEFLVPTKVSPQKDIGIDVQETEEDYSIHFVSNDNKIEYFLVSKETKPWTALLYLLRKVTMEMPLVYEKG
jgi:hypothetical protein